MSLPFPTPVFVVFDYETTGLEPAEGAEPIELAAIALRSDTLEEVGRFPARIMRVMNPHRVSAKALETNGKTVEQIMAGEDPRIVHEEFLEWAASFIPEEDFKKEPRFRRRVILVAHNDKFDIGFLKSVARRYLKPGIYDQIIDYHSICTFGLSYSKKVLIEKTMVDKEWGTPAMLGRPSVPLKGSLVNMAKFYGIPHDAHQAMGDVEATAELLRRIWAEMKQERQDAHDYRNPSANGL